MAGAELEGGKRWIVISLPFPPGQTVTLVTPAPTISSEDGRLVCAGDMTGSLRSGRSLDPIDSMEGEEVSCVGSVGGDKGGEGGNVAVEERVRRRIGKTDCVKPDSPHVSKGTYDRNKLSGNSHTLSIPYRHLCNISFPSPFHHPSYTLHQPFPFPLSPLLPRHSIRSPSCTTSRSHGGYKYQANMLRRRNMFDVDSRGKRGSEGLVDAEKQGEDAKDQMQKDEERVRYGKK